MPVWRLVWVVLLAASLTSCAPASSPETSTSPSASPSVVDVDVVSVRVATLDDEINAEVLEGDLKLGDKVLIGEQRSGQSAAGPFRFGL